MEQHRLDDRDDTHGNVRRERPVGTVQTEPVGMVGGEVDEVLGAEVAAVEIEDDAVLGWRTGSPTVAARVLGRP